LCLLQLNADALMKCGFSGAPVQSQQLYRACIGWGQPFADFNGRGLPCPIGPEQAETFSTGDFEVETIHGDDIAEGFSQTAQQERGAILLGS
jgi:hypothetical protein